MTNTGSKTSVADISVAFPYRNESKTLETTLELIGRQTLMPREVFFINSSSTDDSSRIIDDWIKENQPRFETRFHNIFEGTDTPSSSKNVAVKRAASTWIAFMDCGLIFEKDWLRKQWDYVQNHPEVELVSGGCVLGGVGIIDMSAVAQTYGYKNFRPTVPTTLVKKSVFDKTGLFLADRRAGYDMAWTLLLEKLGIKRGINKSVVIRYIGVNYGNSLMRTFRKSIVYAAPTVGLPYYYVPYYYLSALIIFLCFCVLHPRSSWFFLAAYVLFRGYFYPAKKSNGFALVKERKLALLTLPLLGIVIDAGRTLGIIQGICLAAGAGGPTFGPGGPAPRPALLSGLGWIGLLYGAAKAATLSTQLLAGRLLGPAEFGRANLVIAATAYLQIVPMLGFPLATSKLVSDERDEERLSRLISTALAAFAAWTLLSIPLLAAAHRFLERALGVSPPLFLLAVLLAAATALSQVLASPLLGLKRFARRGFVETVYGICAPVLLIGFIAVLGRTHQAMIFAFSGSLLASSSYALWSVRRYLKPSFEPGFVAAVGRYAATATLTLLATACVLAPARLFLNRHAGAREVGLFSAYFTSTVQVALALLYMLQAVLIPMAGGEGQREIWALFRRWAAPAALAAWAFFAAAAVAGLAVFGRRYPLDLVWAATFAAAAALILVHGAASDLYAARDFSGLRVSVIGALIAGLGNLALTALLVPKFGVLGAALSLVVSFGAGLAFYGFFGAWERSRP